MGHQAQTDNQVPRDSKDHQDRLVPSVSQDLTDHPAVPELWDSLDWQDRPDLQARQGVQGRTDLRVLRVLKVARDRVGRSEVQDQRDLLVLQDFLGPRDQWALLELQALQVTLEPVVQQVSRVQADKQDLPGLRELLDQ